MTRPAHTSQHQPVPGAVHVNATREALAIVRWAVQQRRNMMARGWSRLDHYTVDRALVPLVRWLDAHPVHASAQALKELLRTYGDQLRLVMPATLAGRRRMERLDNILFDL